MTHKKVAKIESTMLGIEDHGIFTLQLFVDYGGSGQAVGGYALDRYSDVMKSRMGTAFGMEWIRRVLLACGVESWEKVKGRTIYVYTEDESWNAKPTGIGPLPTEPGKDFFFDNLMTTANGYEMKVGL